MPTGSQLKDQKESSSGKIINTGIEAFLGNLDRFLDSRRKAPVNKNTEPVSPGKWNIYSEYAGLVFNLILAGQYLWLWISPDANDVNKIFSLSTLILF